MKLNKLASTISRGLWLIEPRTAFSMLPLAVKFMNGEQIEFFEENTPELPRMYSPQAGFFDFDTDADECLLEQQGVLIIPMNGVMMKDDDCGEPGTDTLGCWFKAAMENPNIIGIVLKINSGGGSVAGTGEFADLIKTATKPVVAWTDAVMASAAYWIGSSASEIWASHRTVEIGSIGTAISFTDYRGAMEKWGVKEHYINADSSPDKNMDYFNALDGDTSGIKDNILNPTNEIFMDSVKSNRGDKLNIITKIQDGDGLSLNEPLTGKMYLAESAIAIGLIDQIGNLEQAIDRVIELAA